MSRSGIKRIKWFGCQLISESVFVVCDHNIDAVFSAFTRGEIVTFYEKVILFGKGVFRFGINRSYVTAGNTSQCIHTIKAATCFFPHKI